MTENSDDPAQRAVLVQLFGDTSGPRWENKVYWNSSVSYCQWYGIRCDNGNVTSINLFSNQLQGTISPSISQLKYLRTMTIASNPGLSGVLPSSLPQIADLVVLDLSSNSLVGTIPPSFGSWQRIIFLSLQANFLSGTIPPELGALKSITGLRLSKNLDISGTVPKSFGNLTALRELELTQLGITGFLPSEILAELGYSLTPFGLW